ncbi:MAG: hypothetical protein ABH877_00670 [bacterium]
MKTNTTPNWMIANYYESKMIIEGEKAEISVLTETAQRAVRRAVERYSLTCSCEEHRKAAEAYLAAPSKKTAYEMYLSYPPQHGTTAMTCSSAMALEDERFLDALICCASATANEGPVVGQQDMVDAEYRRNLRVLTFLSGNPV